jgi:hypothetical protein
MVEILNGADDGPLAGWVIAVAHGLTFVGKPLEPHAGAMTLRPVYGLHCLMQMVQPDPRRPPQLMTIRQVQPFLTYPSIRQVHLPTDAIVVPCESLSRDERRELMKSIAGCEELMGAMRAQEAGIMVAPANTKLPPVRP